MALPTKLLACLTAAVVGTGALSAAGRFVPPTAEAARAAVGPLDTLAIGARHLLTPDDDFAPVDAPAPGDWLAEHDEPGQTFADFARGASTFVPERQFLYLQPLGGFAVAASPDLEDLASYASAFFQLPVRTLPPQDIDGRRLQVRLNRQTRQPQILTTAILAELRNELPADAHALIAVTMVDLYPAADWNFVFGQASLGDRVGVFSFARHDPAFFDETPPDDAGALIFRRSATTLVHEISHTFGLHHCIFFRCVMNGSNHQAESDRQPPHLCPVCLHKLQHAVGIDLEKRYRDLEFVFAARGWREEEAWVKRQLARARPEAPRIEASPPVRTEPAMPPIDRPRPPPPDLPRPPAPGRIQ